MLDPKYFQEEKTFAQRLWMISSVCIFFWVSEMKGVPPSWRLSFISIRPAHDLKIKFRAWSPHAWQVRASGWPNSKILIPSFSTGPKLRSAHRSHHAVSWILEALKSNLLILGLIPCVLCSLLPPVWSHQDPQTNFARCPGNNSTLSWVLGLEAPWKPTLMW